MLDDLQRYWAAAGRLVFNAVQLGAFDSFVVITKTDGRESRSNNAVKDLIDTCQENYHIPHERFASLWILVCQNWLRHRSKTAIPASTGMPDALYVFRDNCRQVAMIIIRDAERVEGEDSLRALELRELAKQLMGVPDHFDDHYPADHFESKFGLTPNRLNQAQRRGRLKRSEKRGGRWFHSLSEVREVFPDACKDDET